VRFVPQGGSWGPEDSRRPFPLRQERTVDWVWCSEIAEGPHWQEVANKSGRSLQPSALAECRKINSRRSIPSPCAVTSTELQSDLLVAIRNSQWCTCSEIWRSRSRFDGIGLVFPRPLRRRRRLRRN